jgi:hypothetical protein
VNWDADSMQSDVDVFISYAGRDRAWAEWAAWHLTEANYSVELDYWDWSVGDDFLLRINDALGAAKHVLALLSHAYFERGRFTTPEWLAVMADRSRFDARPLLPLRVERVRAATAVAVTGAR